MVDRVRTRDLAFLTAETPQTPAHNATIEIFDASGRCVRKLTTGAVLAGNAHEVAWNRRDSQGAIVPSGIYFYRLTAGDFREQMKMVLLPGS